jgi:hypothetical protein
LPFRQISKQVSPIRAGVNRQNLNITSAGGAVSLKLPLSAQPVQYILVLGARPQSPGVCDITDLYLAKFHLLPVGQRIFMRTVQQINGWRDLPQTISARIPDP